jgi:phosphatidylglycerophosphate synthase
MGDIRISQRLGDGKVRLAPVVRPADRESRLREERVHLVKRHEPDGVGAGHSYPLRLRQCSSLLEREREATAGGERARDGLEQRPLVAKREHRLEQEHHVEGALGERRDLRDEEAARQVADALTCFGDGLLACVHAEVRAIKLLRQESARPSDPATQVENGDAWTDARPLRQSPNLGGPDEALLFDILGGPERRPLGLFQSLGCKPTHARHRSLLRMLERGATLRAGRSPLAGLGNQLGPLVGLGAALLLLAVLARTVGLGGAGWLIGLASGLTLNLLLARALWRDPSARLGPAGWVTLLRATLVVGVTALTAASFERDVAVATLVSLALVALALDFVDGWIARRTATESTLGAKLDGEVDAFLILVLSIEVAPTVGAWVLAIGLARYAFLAAGWALPWMRAPLPRRDWRKTVTASQGVTLAIAASGVVPATVSRILLAVALAMLAESFGRDIWWLWRQRGSAPARDAAVRRRHPAVTGCLTLLALAVVWAALVAPIRPWLLAPRSFVRLPLEGLVLVALAVALPSRARHVVPWVIGPLLGLLVLLKVVDLGFFIFLNRQFNPVEDWSYLPIGIATVRDTFGSRDADLAVATGVLLALAALVIPALALGQLTRVAVRHRRRTFAALAFLSTAWAMCWAFGAQVSGATVATTSAAHLAANEVNAVQADIRSQAHFKALLSRKDAFLSKPSGQLLEGLRGKDVLLVFVESYGQIALQGTPFSPGIDDVVNAGTQQLQSDGFSSRSGWLATPNFGGGSWLADATLQSGVWVNSPGRYSELIASKRLTLAAAFRRAGWRTVADMPATHGSWPEGRSFYRYEKIYERANITYRGPRFGFSTMPDQYALHVLQEQQLAKRSRPPVFSEIFLTSSHEPWIRIPPLISWNRLGNGAIYNRLPIDRVGLTDTQHGYSKSIMYTLHTVYSFIERYGTKNSVLILLGDEQPARVVDQANHDVPATIIAHDPRVLQKVSSWGWTNGLLPAPTAPVWAENTFRDRFLNAFDH